MRWTNLSCHPKPGFAPPLSGCRGRAMQVVHRPEGPSAPPPTPRRRPPGDPSSGRARRSTGQGLGAWTGEPGPTGSERREGGGITKTTRAAERRAHHERPTSRTTQPLEPPPTPDPTSPVRTTPIPSSPDPPPPPRVASTAHPPAPISSLATRPTAALDPIAAAPPPAHPLPPGLTHPGLPGRSRKGVSGAKRRTPPSSKAQAGSQGNSRGRGGGLCAQGRNPWSETDGGKHKEGNSPERGARLCGCSKPQRQAPRTARPL